MKTTLFAILGTLLISSAFAQMPNTDAMKNSVNDAANTSAAQVQNVKQTADTTKASATDSAKSMKEKALVNINTASKADLAKLPGIGDARAQAIINGRPYKTTADLMKVKGIKSGVYAKIKNQVSVE